MATIANCTQPVTVATVDSVPVPRISVFPVPPTAWGFATELDLDLYPFIALGPPYQIIGAVYPESDFLEPTIGQIWPRIG